MNKIESRVDYCLACMEEHEVDIVLMMDTEIYNEKEVTFVAMYKYCPKSGVLTEAEEMFRDNILSMRSAYKDKAS